MTKKEMIINELMENNMTREAATVAAENLLKKVKTVDPSKEALKERKADDKADRDYVREEIKYYSQDTKTHFATFCGTLLGNWERLGRIFGRYCGMDKAQAVKTVEDIMALVPECMKNEYGTVCVWDRTPNPEYVPAEKTKSGKVKKAAVGKPTLPCFVKVGRAYGKKKIMWSLPMFAKVLYQGYKLEGKCASFSDYLKCEAEAAKVEAETAEQK